MLSNPLRPTLSIASSRRRSTKCRSFGKAMLLSGATATRTRSAPVSLRLSFVKYRPSWSLLRSSSALRKPRLRRRSSKSSFWRTRAGAGKNATHNF